MLRMKDNTTGRQVAKGFGFATDGSESDFLEKAKAAQNKAIAYGRYNFNTVLLKVAHRRRASSRRRRGRGGGGAEPPIIWLLRHCGPPLPIHSMAPLGLPGRI